MKTIKMEIARSWWFLAALLGPIIGNLVMIVILVVLFFWGKSMIVNSLQVYIPENLLNTITNVVFGILIIYFAMKMFRR